MQYKYSLDGFSFNVWYGILRESNPVKVKIKSNPVIVKKVSFGTYFFVLRGLTDRRPRLIRDGRDLHDISNRS